MFQGMESLLLATLVVTLRIKIAELLGIKTDFNSTLTSNELIFGALFKIVEVCHLC